MSDVALKIRRGTRREAYRSVILDVRRQSKRELCAGREQYPEDTSEFRPRTRGACVDADRPCPFLSCRYHLAIDVMPNGNIKLNFPDAELEDMPETCALDVAERGATLEEAGAYLNITRERIRQIEALALAKPGVRELLADYEGHVGARAVSGCETEES